MSNSTESTKTTEEYVVEFIKALKAVEDEMEPYKEHRRDLKKNYLENAWLSRDELRLAVKAYRMIKSEDDFGELTTYYDKLRKTVGA
tara:strand:+ start:204 stop:464 length:261 start_codon:yes stop_codon:yes gene_type:complete